MLSVDRKRSKSRTQTYVPPAPESPEWVFGKLCTGPSVWNATFLESTNGRKIGTEQDPTVRTMTNENTDHSENGHVPLIDTANVTLSEQESELVDRLIDGTEHGTSISADEMEAALVDADISDEHREATTDDLVHVYRHRVADAE
ncbi:hypothetical protein [Halococcus salsus]|uniref:hypothetical protein n=1 Tax=Halococcus salsus TaxID=2162894 RepID=UPI001F04BF01|nr:hypothetical protein [Halococcus salsus]